MLAQAVAYDELDVGERERRRIAGLVDPAQRAGADHELVLLEEPVGGHVVVGGARRVDEVEPADPDAAALVAAHVQARAVDEQLREARLERKHRARRQRREDARQLERDALLGVVDANVAQLDRGHPAARVCRDRTDLDRGADHGARARLDLRAPLLDVRQTLPVK